MIACVTILLLLKMKMETIVHYGIEYKINIENVTLSFTYI